MSYTTVPYVIAFAGEERRDRLVFERHTGSDGGLRLAYAVPRAGDRVGGILRARVRDLRARPARRGPERMRKLNTRRQWACMDRLLCQVCARPAADPGTGRTWWILVPSVFEPTAMTGLHPDRPWTEGACDEGRTNAPPTCRDCVGIALRECPMLQQHALVCTAERVVSAGVLADMYEPGPGLAPRPTAHNVYIAWDAFSRHPRALATSQVVQLYGVESSVTLAPGSGAHDLPGPRAAP
ncbi:hypothetical protein ACQEUU_37825 [Nonomuraea sp. CA-218870]|uniref:hypothetical protein n=1 Tax=Nonomuraea sp. CA-218870 TaxID=3239998 RepID=UPI003D89ED44